MDKPKPHLRDLCDCAVCHPPEQPNTELMIIKTIQGLMSQVNDNLGKLRENTYFAPVGKRALIIAKALKEIDSFEKTTLFELQKAFE